MADNGGIITYKWAGNGDITQADIRNYKNGAIAYLYPSEDVRHLEQLKEIFRGNKWTISYGTRNGKPVLRVSGLPNENALVNLLQQGGYAEGKAQVIRPVQKNVSRLDALKRNSKPLSAILYSAGDATMLESGRRHGSNRWQMGTGAAFMAGDIAFAAFGGDDEHSKFTAFLQGAVKRFQEEDVKIPKDSAMHAETTAKPGEPRESAYEFIHKYITPFKIIAEIVGGALLFKAGKAKSDEKHPDRNPSPRKQVSGAVIVTGWTAALLTPEKKLDKEKYDKAGTLKKLWMKIQSNPLSLAGAAGLIHNASFTIAAFEERDRYKHPEKYIGKKVASGTKYWWMDLLSIVAFMLPANILFAISKKKGTTDPIENGALTEDAFGIMAQVISQQPEANRQHAFNVAVDFLAERPEIKETKPEIISHLHQEIEALQRNPWFTAKAPGNNAPEEKAPPSKTFSHQEKIQAEPDGIPAGIGR